MQQKGNEYKYLASSEYEDRGVSKAMAEKFAKRGINQSVMISYRGIPNSSPLFEGLAHNISAKFGILHVMVNLKTLLHLLDVLDKSFTTFDKYRIKPNEDVVNDKKENVSSQNKQELSVPKKKEDFTLVHVEATFQSLGVSFPTPNGLFMEAFMDESKIDVQMMDSNFIHVKGELGALTLDYNNQDIKKVYPHLMDIKGENLIKFAVDYQLGDGLHLPLPEDADENTIPCNANIKLDMNSVQFIYTQKFIEELVAFFIQ